MAIHFQQLLQALVNQPQAAIGDLELLTETEKLQLLNDFNSTEAEFPKEKTIHELFEAQVEKTPDNIAVVFGEQSLTYRDLNSRANRVARVLREKGLQSGELVGIQVNRSVDMVIGVLSVWKAGGAYVPIDPDYPSERIQYMLEESRARLLLTQKSISEQVSFSGEVINLDEPFMEWEEKTNLHSVTKLNDLAYVMFTSGTTGLPKGVMIEHRNIQSMYYAWVEFYQLDSFSVNLLQMASFSFDVFVQDFARSLLNGGKMVICSNEDRLDPAALSRIMARHEVSFVESTPALIFPLMERIEESQIRSLKLIIIGGDSCPTLEFEKSCKTDWVHTHALLIAMASRKPVWRPVALNWT